MKTRKFQRTASVLSDREITPFNLVDDKGRAISFEIEAFEVSYLELPEDATSWWPNNPAFIATTKNIRGGVQYGKITPEIYGDTLAEVMTKARKRRAGALKRQTKNFGSSS